MPKIYFKPRLYQETILKTAITKNTLTVLGTGLGKTKIGILLTIERLKQYPNSKILFLTPTKPLADQIQKEFKQETDIKDITLFTGKVSPAKRKKLAQDSTIIVSTPQTISNDIINNRINLEEFSLLVIDEAHRAVKNYDYVWIAKQYHKKSEFPRILGLTASPGSTIETIQDICKNLKIEEIEARTENDPDVKKYIKTLDVDWIKIPLSTEIIEIQKHIKQALEQRLLELKNLKAIYSTQVSKKELLKIQAMIHGKIAHGEKSFDLFRSISVIAETIKIQHAKEMLETQNLHAFYNYIEGVYQSAEKTKVKAIKSIAKDLNIKSAYILTEKLIKLGIEHPKIEKIKEIIKKQIKQDKDIKIIIFNNFRDSAQYLAKQLEPIAKTKLFVGQTIKSGTGLTQKKQIEILDNFSKGKFNILVATSIGEEGLDIEKVDLVIFYEPVPSAIRSIQRRGRTARLEKGKLIVLMAQNTIDEVYHWVAYHKEKNMHKIIKQLKEKIQLQNQKSISDYLKKPKKSDLKIYADTREKGSTIVKLIVENGLNVTTQNLTTDYVVSEKCGIELKTKVDFVNSIIDKRLLHQLKNLKQNFEKPVLILQGTEDIYSIRKIHPNAIRGMLATIAISYKIPILNSTSPKDTAGLIEALAKREQENEKRGFAINTGIKPLTTKEQQEFIIESLPGIGPSLAKSLLKKFKTIKKIINTKPKNLEKIENLGEKKIKEIQRILKEEYQD